MPRHRYRVLALHGSGDRSVERLETHLTALGDHPEIHLEIIRLPAKHKDLTAFADLLEQEGIPLPERWDRKTLNLAVQEVAKRFQMVAVLLTPELLDSPFKDTFLSFRHSNARIAPLIVEPCAWQETALAGLASFPREGSLNDVPDTGEAWAGLGSALGRTIFRDCGLKDPGNRIPRR